MVFDRPEVITTRRQCPKPIEGIVNVIMSYKFTELSRQEIDAMLGTKFEETRIYQETREEGREEGREEERKAIALKMLQKNKPIAEIIEITELTIAQVQALQSQDNQQH
jgi:predicted transposase/invertase (TIGR01784 family)